MRSVTGVAAALVAALAVSGCAIPSAYDKTYNEETQRLEDRQAAWDSAEHAAHEEARRFAAIVYFDVGSTTIQKEGLTELGWLVDQLRPYPQAILEVRGFADSTGAEANNQKLSDERADNVARHLESLGYDRSRIVTSGFGEEIPAASDKTSAGRKSNRRVEVTVR